MTPRLTVTAADGTRLAVDSYGSGGRGLLVLSGSAAPPGGYRNLARKLAADFTVHVLHRRGRGASGPQGAAYSVDLEAGDVLAVMRATGARVVFGHSYGGLLAIWAGLNPDASSLIDRLIAYEPPLPVDGSLPTGFLDDFETALRDGRLARAQTILTRGLSVAGPLERLPFAADVAVSWLMQRTIARAMGQMLSTVPAEIVAAQAVDGPATTYRSLEVPTVLLLGERGPAWIHDAVRAAQGQMPAATLELVAGVGHNAPLLSPGHVAAAITRVAVEPAG